VAGEDLVDDVLIDFHDVERQLAAELEVLDHVDLSASNLLGGRPPTPAAIARWLHERLAERLGAALVRIEVRDSDASGARYTPD